MTQEIIRTLKKLSSASEEALESLEAYDYRQEVKSLKDNQLPLHSMPKTIRQIFNSVMKYCIPIIDEYETEQSCTLLNADNIKAFTERGLYMLATILKSPQAVSTTLAIIDTFTMTRQLARTMESLQTVEDGGEQQKTLLQKTGEILADIVGNNLSTATSETEIELNFAVVKIKHKITRKKDQ